MAVSVLSRWGNSLALRVPREAASGFKEGDRFEVFADESGLRFRKARKIKKYDIKETPESISSEPGGELD